MTNTLLIIIAVLLAVRIVLQLRQGKVCMLRLTYCNSRFSKLKTYKLIKAAIFAR